MSLIILLAALRKSVVIIVLVIPEGHSSISCVWAVRKLNTHWLWVFHYNAAERVNSIVDVCD